MHQTREGKAMGENEWMPDAYDSTELCGPPLPSHLLPCPTQTRALPEPEGAPRKTADCHFAHD